MTDPTISTPKRLLRVLIGGAILATAWIAFDALSHADAASAAELPTGQISDTTDGVSDVISDVISTVVSPLVAPVASLAEQVSTAPQTAVEQAVTAIGATPSTVIAPVVDVLTAPLLPAAGDVVDALPAVPVVPTLSLPNLGALSLNLPNAGLLIAGGALALGVALAASSIPLLPTPAGGLPRDPPTVQSPGFDAASAAPNSASLAPPGSALTSRALSGGTPPSPTYGFDTTPD